MLDVLGFVNKEKEKLKNLVAKLTKIDRKPRIAIITDDSNFDANQSYIKSKTAFAMDIDVSCDVIVLKNGDPLPRLASYDGVIIQYPFRDFTFEQFKDFVTENVPGYLDIDGIGEKAKYKACTPLGIVTYLEHLRDTKVIDKYNVTVNVVGCGGLVGEPLVDLLMQDKSYTVCVTRSNTDEWVADNFQASADVIVCATPKHNLIRYPDWRKIYVDCGCNLVNGKLLGNVCREAYCDEAQITPVPNGVGRLTVLALYKNLLDAYRYKNSVEFI